MPTPPLQPVTSGIADVQSLLTWTSQDDPFGPFNQATIPLRPRAGTPAGPLVLNCQGLDYAPFFPQGSTDNDVLNFSYWQYVDVFNFFGGQNRFVIPPPGWTNAAHRNGVPMLGSFFVGDYQTASDEVTKLVNAPDSVAQMVNVMQYYGFDGWLFNIEPFIPIPGPFATFLGKLQTALKAANPNALVFFYSDFTALQYESGFLPVCDGVFIDYGWESGTGPNSIAASTQLAGARNFAVYAGIDVYGRFNMPGGYQTWIPVNYAVQAKASLALFCPGWTYQNASTPLNGFAFADGEDRFWAGGKDQSAPANCIAQFIPPRAAVSAFPFVTHFNVGQGGTFCVRGQLTEPVTGGWPQPWSNLSMQDVLPTWRWALAAGSAAACSLELSPACPFDGGSCLRISGAPGTTPSFATYRLYAAALAFGTEEITVTFTYAAGCNLPGGSPNQVSYAPDLALALLLDNGTALVLLTSAGAPCANQPLGGEWSVTSLAPTSSSQQPGTGGAGSSFNWTLVQFNLGTSCSGRTVQEIRLVTAWPQGTSDVPANSVDWTSLGEIKLLAGTPPSPSAATDIVWQEVAYSQDAKGRTFATLNLSWTAPAGTQVDHYEIYAGSVNNWQWIGRAYGPQWWVAAVYNSSGGATLSFGVQCVDVYGDAQPMSAIAVGNMPWQP